MNLSEFHSEKIRLIEEYTKNNPEIVQFIQEKLPADLGKSDAKDILLIFLSNIKGFAGQEKYNEFADKLLSEESITNLFGIEGHENFFIYNPDVEFVTLDNMLKKEFEKHGKEYVENGLEYANENAGQNGNPLDSFIKYIAITNFQNIECQESFNSLNGSIERYQCDLDGYALGKVTLEYPEEENEDIEPDMLKIRNGLEGIRLGQVLLKYLICKVHKDNPDKSLVSHTVMKQNFPAIKLYERMGGVFYDDDNNVIENPTEMQDNDFSTEYCTVRFENTNFFLVENMVIEPPEIEKEKIKKIEEKNAEKTVDENVVDEKEQDQDGERTC